MPAASALARAIKAFAAVARRRRLRWYIFGGQAVAVHGRPRMTLDIDITIELGDVALEDLLAELGRAGFEPRVRWSPAEVELLRVVPVVHRASRVPVDLVLAGEGLEAEFLTRARPVDLGGVRAPVISPEDLVVTKLLAGRPQDRADVAGILQHLRGKLDLDRVRGLLAELDRALDQSDLTAGLDNLLAEVAPSPRKPRRR